VPLAGGEMNVDEAETRVVDDETGNNSSLSSTQEEMTVTSQLRNYEHDRMPTTIRREADLVPVHPSDSSLDRRDGDVSKVTMLEVLDKDAGEEADEV
jgi:hypothetical protein